MSNFTVVFDACVLYPSPLCSFLMYLAMTDLYRTRWSSGIHEEWIRSVQKRYPDFTRQQGEKIRDLMNAHARDCLVTGYERLIPALTLPDPDDRHVLAAAIRCGADLIVTFNLKHFPESALKPYGIGAQHPDDFLSFQFDLAPSIVCVAAQRHRASLKTPLKSADEYLATLESQGLLQTVARLRQFAEMI